MKQKILLSMILIGLIFIVTTLLSDKPTLIKHTPPVTMVTVLKSTKVEKDKPTADVPKTSKVPQKVVLKEKEQSLKKEKVVDVFQSYRRTKEPIKIVDMYEAKDFLAKKLNLLVEDVAYEESRLGTNGSTYFRFTQTYKGLNVYGSNFTVQVSKNKKLEAIIAKYANEISLDITPSIEGEVALSNVLLLLADKKEKVYENPTLMVYVDYDNNPYLAYSSVVKYIDKEGTEQIKKIFINAKDGSLLNTTSRQFTSHDVRIYQTATNYCLSQQNARYILPGYLARSDDRAYGDTHVDASYDYLGDAYWFFKHMFNRDSFDANGATITATVNMRFQEQYSCTGLNAFFSPDDAQLMFGKGDSSQGIGNFAGAADVVAHELTHALTWKTSNLEYQNESGALSESISDIFGVTVQAWVKSGGGKAGNPATITIDSDTWVLGEYMVSEAWKRYMNDPAKDGKSPDTYAEIQRGTEDSGYVHSNSGITNLAYALLAGGGKHPRGKTSMNVPAIGLDKAIRIWYEAQTTTIGSRTTLSGIRASVANAASSLYGECSNEYKSVQLSFDAVEIPGTWECVESDSTPPTITSTTPTNGATDISLNSNITILFSETLDSNSITSSTISLKKNGVEVPSSVSLSGGQTVILKPNEALITDTLYTVEITTGVSDSAGNILTQKSTTTFRTQKSNVEAPTEAVKLLSSTPSDAQNAVSIDTLVTAVFSQEISNDASRYGMTLSTSDGNLIAGSLRVNNNKLVYQSDVPLAYETTYTVKVLASRIKNLSGVALDKDYSFTFVTKAKPTDGSANLEESYKNAVMSVTSQLDNGYPARNLNDNDPSTLWTSQTLEGILFNSETIECQLESPTYVESLTINWSASYYSFSTTLSVKIDGEWQETDSILKFLKGDESFYIDQVIEGYKIELDYGWIGTWFIITDIILK